MIRYILLSIFGAILNLTAATYYVATNGNNANPGTIGSPFLTIQKGADVAVAGDTVKVGVGSYNESVWPDTANGSNGLPITFDGQNLASVKSWIFGHPYHNLINFTVTGGATVFGGAAFIGQNASHIVISNNVFDAAFNTNITPLIKWSGPDAIPFGTAGSDNLLISNVFKNVRGEMFFRLYGDRNVISGNQLLNSDFADFFQISGRSNYIVGNTLSNLFYSGLNENHADILQIFGNAGGSLFGSRGHLFESNIVVKAEYLSQLGNLTDDSNTNVTDLTIRNNIFVGIAAKASIAMPNVWVYNNFFYQCATNLENGGPLLIFTDSGAIGKGNGGRVFNNIFIDCGPAGTTNSGGTYFSTTLTDVLSDYNYVSKTTANSTYGAVKIDPSHRAIGDPGGWDVSDWWEPHGYNGVYNSSSPLLANLFSTSFSPENYRLGFGSPLIGKGLYLTNFTTDIRGISRGTVNWDIGPYQSDFNSIPSQINGRLIRAYSTVASGAITIWWPTNTYRLSLNIAKRIYTNNPSAWTAFSSSLFTTTNISAGSFTDTAVTNGIHYEYELSQVTSTNYANSDGFQYTDFEYISTGYQVPLKDARGNVILLIATNIAAGISTELTQLRNDLWGDGYKIYEHLAITSEVTAANWKTNITAIKAMITNDFNLNTNADWFLFIIGHVPIPYSGLASPGSHTDNLGANPADWYWVDNIESSWTDSTVNNSTADFSSNWNTPGDGKFDPTFVPNVPKMKVSRIDFANLPAFSLTETQLLQQYLNRNHQWRHKQFTVRDLSMIYTNGRPNEAHNRSSSIFGSYEANVDHVSWLDKSTNFINSYLLAFKAGSGHYDVDGVSPVQLGTIQDFRDKHLYTVYPAMFGSYYGNWDGLQNSNIVLWAPLATTGYTIATYYCSDMVPIDSSSMGEPIGQELFSMAANKLIGYPKCYSPYWRGAFLILEEWNVYNSLLGDGTIKLQNVFPPSNFIAVNSGSDVVLTWTTSVDSNIQGYHVYRSGTNDLNNLARLTTNPVTSTGYTNTGAASGHYTYSVRAVKLEQDTSNRSFYNASQGIFADNSGGSSPTIPEGSRLTSPFTFRSATIVR
jgi:hypothetical protein